MAFETILYEKLDNVAKITMNRPEMRNAENRQMSKELAEAFSMAEEDDEIRVIILAGEGPSFSSGHDMGSPAAIAESKKHRIRIGTIEQWRHEENRWLKFCLRVRDMEKPTIAQVQGYCIMGGMMLATMCDLIIASEDARFADMAVRMGGPAIEYFTHPWELGIRKCKEFLFTGDYIDAQEAWRLGMVNRVVPREKLEEETMNLAKRIALQNPTALKFAKLAVNDTQDFMGFRHSINSLFKMHQLAHAYWVTDPQLSPRSRQAAPGVREYLKARDEKFK